MKFFILALLIFLDFISKQIILNFIKLNELVSLVFFLDITHIHNYGIAFGLFSDVLPILKFGDQVDPKTGLEKIKDGDASRENIFPSLQENSNK